MEATLMRQPRIRQQRDVGERHDLADQKTSRGQLVLKPCERSIATLDLVGIEIEGRLAEILHLKPAHRHVRFMAVLLPEQPLIHLRRREWVCRNERSAPLETAV